MIDHVGVGGAYERSGVRAVGSGGRSINWDMAFLPVLQGNRPLIDSS